MINANELRRFNKVVFAEDGTVFDVLMIEETGLIVKNEEEIFWCKIDQFEGIPLTFEWLRNFCFTLEDVGTNPTEEELRYRHAYKGSFGIEFDTQKGTFTLHNVVGELVEYQYVHHLQNVYYWNTMMELEIKDLDPQNVHKIS